MPDSHAIDPQTRADLIALREQHDDTWHPPAEDRLLVQRMAMLATPHKDIAMMVLRNGRAISVEVLERHFQAELVTGRGRMIAEVGAKMVERATDNEHKDSQRAGEWLLSRFGGDQYRDPDKKRGPEEDSETVKESTRRAAVAALSGMAEIFGNIAASKRAIQPDGVIRAPQHDKVLDLQPVIPGSAK